MFLVVTLAGNEVALISKYTLKPYRGHQTARNSAATAKHIQRQFDVGAK
ncbi:MAG: hypothetical protein J6568_04150 [Snodgrassella sp.]|nr:hypothetical protein [Snodgrassella sp.]